MQTQPLKLKDQLVASGVAANDVHQTIFRNVYPLPHRVWWTLRVTLNRDPFTAEWQFVDDLAVARTVSDIDEALFDYRCQRRDYKVFLLHPSRHRARSYFSRVMKSEC